MFCNFAKHIANWALSVQMHGPTGNIAISDVHKHHFNILETMPSTGPIEQIILKALE